MSKDFSPIISCKFDSNRDRDAQQEIDTFLAALSSYPDRFAKDPALSFEKHLVLMSNDTQAEQPEVEHRD